MSARGREAEIEDCRVAVAVLNWNGMAHLRRFLPSVVSHTALPDRVVVIDNGSTDESLSLLATEFPEALVVSLPDNLGFAGGYNEGVARLSSSLSFQWLVLLNSDVEVVSGWLDGMVSACVEHGWTAAQPKMRAVERRAEFEYAGAAGGYMDRNGFMFCAGRMFNVHELDHGQYDADRPVFWASGASLLIKADAWFDVDGLDEDFFAHMEEIDLCWRLKNRGHVVGATGRTHVYHLGGGTLQQENPRKAFLNFRNNLFLLLKNDHRPGIRWRLLYRQLLDGIAGLRFLLEGKTSFFRAVVDAHAAFRKARPRMVEKRNQEMNACRGIHLSEAASAGKYSRSVVWDHFVRGRRTFNALPEDRFS